MLLVVDNGSIYTQNLINFLTEKNIDFKQQTPHLLNLDSVNRFDSFILSGRRKNEKKINEINSKIITHCIANDKKLLGICYGAEILALTLGGTIRRTSLQKGDEHVETMEKNLISDGPLQVFESHSFEISKLPDDLLLLAQSKNCKYEMIKHKKMSIFGTQFHPEMSNDGKKLIEKFCSL